MEDALEGYISQLANCTPSLYVDYNERVQRTKEITEDIKDIVSKSDNYSIVPVLLEPNLGLTSLLSKFSAVHKKDVNYVTSVENIMGILIELMVKFRENMSNYLVSIKNSAVSFISSAEKKLRKISFSVLCKVVVTAHLISSEEIVTQLDLPALSKQLFELLAKTESSKTLRNKFLVLLGTLAQYFPFALEDNAGRIINQLVYELEKEVKNVDRDNKVVAGCMEALAGFLYSFHAIVTQKVLKAIHDFLLTVILRALTFKPRSSLVTQRVALDLLAEQATLFKKWLLDQFKTWFDALKSCTLSTKPVEIQESGLKALEKFIEESVQCLKIEVDSVRKSAILDFFVRSIREILECDQSPVQLKIVGVKALGECSFSVTGENVSRIFEYLLKKTAFICIQDDASTKNEDLLPACLESLGLVLMRYTTPLETEQTKQLQKMFVHLFLQYLNIADEKRCGRSAAVFLAGVHLVVRNPVSFSDFVGDIVMQSLIRSSRPELDSGNIKKYTSLWVTLMNFSSQTELPFNLEVRFHVSEVLDAQLVFAMSTIIGRLNFFMNDTEGSTEAEAKTDVRCPQNPADWGLFHNLAELTESLLKAIEPKERLQTSLTLFGVQIVEISTKFPLVPGLYRLVATVLHIIGEDLPIIHRTTYQLYISSLIHRLAQLSGDLLVYAVQAVLSSPAWLVTSVKGSVSGALTSALQIGLTYPPMAEWPLDALEHWQTTLPFSSFDALMEDVLPCLEPYLGSVEQLTKDVHFISGKRFTKTKTSTIQGENAAWNEVQRRVVRLLGCMGPKCSRLVSANEDDVIARSATGWQIIGHLEFGLPLSDMKPIIQLDAFLPRIIHLVHHTSEMKIRMAACEFLHASVIFLTGSNARFTEELRLRYPLTPLYSKIFPSILSLAADTDEVIRKLFSDLLFQLVHWFARPAFQKKESAGRRTILGAETALLLEQLLEWACSGVDSFRDLAGDCLSELLTWNIKQTNSDSKLWEDPAVPDFLFQKLRASATHPSPTHRLGAASVLNKLHRIIRESDPLASIFTLDLLAHFVVSLSLAERDASSSGTVHETKQALYHLSRTVCVKKSLFSVPDPRRRVAPFLVQGTISELLDFLLEHAFGVQQHCRHVCVEICIALALPQSLTDVATQFLSKFPLETLLRNEFPFAARLDVYRWLLLHSVIETSVCDADVNFVNQFEAFVNCFDSQTKEELHSVSECLAPAMITENFLAWLGFLIQYLPKSRNNLFVRSDILVYATLLPAKLGFSVFATASRQQLYTCLETILPLLTHHREMIRSVLTSVEFQVDYLDFTNAQSLDIIQGLVVIATSGCMGSDVTYCKSPNTFLKLAVGNIMSDSNVSTRLSSSNMLIELAIVLGLKMEILATELTNPAMIPNSPTVSCGQLLRSKLGHSVFLLVLRHMDSIGPFLPQMGNGDPQQWILLLDLLQVAQKAPQNLLERKKWIVRNVLDAWNTLERHADSYDQRVHLRMVVDCLSKIDNNLVGLNSSVKNWFIFSWNHPRTKISFASELAQLLNIFAVDCSQSEEASLTTELQQFFPNHFPSKTTAFELDSEKPVYFSVLNRMIANVRVPVVFHFLVDMFALEPRHPSLSLFIESVTKEDWTHNDSMHSLCRALNKLYKNATTRTIDPMTRIEMIEMLYVKILKAAPSSVVERHLNELLPDIVQIVGDSRSGLDSLTQKTAVCAFLSVAILRVGSKLLAGSINANFCSLKNIQPSAEGKDFLRFIGSLAMGIRKMKTPLDGNELEMYQSMASHTFRLLLSVVSARSMTEDHFDAFFLGPMSPDFWNAVVGTTKQYNLTVEVDFKRKMFSRYIPTVSPEERSTKDYASSQFLFVSSLKEDVYQFDFNQGSILSTPGSYEAADVQSSSSTPEESSPTKITLMLDAINEHPCMDVLTNFLLTLSKANTVSKSNPIEPKWMISLRKTLLSTSVHPNVVLFIVRLVINLKTIIQPFAQTWYKALLIVFLRKIGGEPLNTLFREGLGAILDWSNHDPPPSDDTEFAKLASKTVQFIVENINHSVYEIARDNMEMFKSVLIVWKKIPMEMPCDTLQELLTMDTGKQILGLQIWDAIILHDFLPTNQEFRLRLNKRLVDLLAIEDKRKMTRICASVCGLLLLRGTDLEFENLVCGALQKWYSKRKVDVFVDLLYEVSRRHSGVLSKFANINLSLLGTIYGPLKTRCLETLAISWPYMEDPWKEIGIETIETILKGSNTGELCPTLSLLLNLIPRIEISEWRPLWPTLVRLSRHQNVECRSRLYDVFKKALDLSDPIDPEFAQAVLRGCTDQDQELAVKMQNFLAEKLPSSTMERLLSYVTDFYSPGSEEFFLPFCTHFLLERSTQSHVYVEPIFDQPLDDIPFEVFDLASFSSQSFSQRLSFGRGFSHGTFHHGWVRATQNVSSHPTISVTQSPANWLMIETQSPEPSVSQTSTTSSPLKMQNTSKQTAGSPLKSWKRFTNKGPPTPTKLSYEPRSKSRETTSNQPTIYRKYRKGELPDIQIPPSALIAPLQAVALQDSPTGKVLFCHLLTAIRKQIKDIQGNDLHFATKLNNALESILERTHPRTSSLIAAIMEYFWINKVEPSIDTEKMARVAKASQLQPLGILVLESSLPVVTVGPIYDHIKKPRLNDEVKRPTSSWFHVADLYGDVNDVDSVRAIVTRLAECKDLTKNAIESETNSDWSKAFQYYSETLGGDAPSAAELNFCNEYRLKCLEELGQWNEIGRLAAKKEPWNTRSLVRNFLQNSKTGQQVQELNRVSLPTVDPALLPDLAALALKMGSKDRAAVCLSKSTDDFLSRYSQLSPLNFRVRQNLLQHVCIITEMQAFLENSNRMGNSSLPQSGDNLVVWDFLLTLRNFFSQSTVEKQQRLLSSESVVSLRLHLANIALEQRNAGLASKLAAMPLGIQETMMPFRHLIESKVFALESLTTSSALGKLDRLILAKEKINSANISAVHWRIDRERSEASLCAQIFQVTRHMQPNDLKLKQDKLVELWDVQPKEMILAGLQHARIQSRLAENQGNAVDIAEAYLILAKYCYEWKSAIPDEDYNSELTRSILASMRHGSLDGQALFPLVMLAVRDSETAAAVFENFRPHVPLSMFLPWVNQLVSHFTSSQAIARLLTDIAERHPTHVKVPYGITRSSFSSELRDMNVTRLLESKLPTDPTWEMFLKSTDYLHPPEKAACELLNSDTCMKDFPAFQSKYLNLPPPTATSAHGHVHYMFSLEFTTKFQENYVHGQLKELISLVNLFKKKSSPGRKSLRDYSPWLANYRLGDGVANELLLPALRGKTLKVEAFRDEIEYLHSKQLPVKLTFIVDGAVEYPVLLKHGEDVRQDERIIQLLDTIDIALMRDVESRKRNLRIRSFQVIPLTTACGIFQWLTDTLTLKAFLETDLQFRSSMSSIKNYIRNTFPALDINYFMNTAQEKLISNYSMISGRVYRYGLSGALKKLSQSPEAFFYLRNRLAASHGAQCSALWILGVGDRHLSNFLVSTKNGDIIGIDYGMAFGTATSRLAIPEIVLCRLTTQFQYLIPGLGLNGPIRESMDHTLRVAKAESGLIIAALSIFVTEPTLDWLKHTEAMAKVRHNNVTSANEENAVSWSPVEIVQRTENLLKGFHPSEITCQDLQRNAIFLTTEGKTLLARLLAIVRGKNMESDADAILFNKRKSENYANYRARFPSEGLSTNQQIECLIEQSTDLACLSRIYSGWEPWV